MSEQNIVNVMVIPDVPKVLPGEQLYVYVPKASFTSPGIIAYNNTQFRIDGNFLFIREDYVSPGVQQKIDELKQYTDDKLQLKQDKEDNNISLAQRPEQKSVVGAINDLGTLTGQAQDTADDAIRKIGDLSTLTTDEKTTIVGAINEVDQHADANKTEIGDLSALTTDEKATLVGAINEVDAHTNTAQQAADAAQATADNATNLANTGISKADGAQTTANTAVDKANDAKATAQEAIMKADGRATSIGFMTAKDAVTALNGYPRNQLKGGDTIWIVEDGTPDLWVTEVAENSVPYNYTTKDKFNQDLVDNKVLQIGYFKTAYQESADKPLTIAWQNVLVKSTDWVASTEFADFPYEAKIELTDFVDYTTVPQVVFDIDDTMSGNYAPICKSGDKCVYIYGKVQDEITLKTVITFAPNVNGASVTGGGYNNRGKWVASTTYEIDDLVYTDNGQYVCIEGITSTTSPEQDTTHWQATFVATGKTKNTLTISGQDNGTGVQKTFDGSTAVEIAFDENTMTAKEVNGVLKVGAKGTIPESVNGQTGAVTIAVPTKTSQLTNDSGFITDADIPTVPTRTSELTNDSGFLTTADIPTKTSQLENDSNFVTTSDIPTSLPQLAGTGVYDPFGTSVGENGDWKPNGTVIASSVTSGWGAGTHKLGTYSGDKTKLTEIVVKRDRLFNYLNVIVPRTSVADGVYTYTKTDEDNTTFTITIDANNEITYTVTGERAYTTYWLQENNTTWYSTRKTLVYDESREVWNADAIVEVNDGGGLKLFYKNELNLYFSRPSVPSSPIRCTYKVRQTSNQGQIVVINQYDGIGNIDGEWSEYIYPNVTLTEAGLYEIYAQNHDAFVYWDGKKLTKKLLRVRYDKTMDTEQTDVQRIYLDVDTIQITSEGVLSIEEANTKYSLEGALIQFGSSFSGFKYRKIK